MLSLLFGVLGLALLAFVAWWGALVVQQRRRMAALRYLLLLVAVLLISVPLSVLVTVVLTPFWRWLEATHGIESVGHSGPAEWCFIAVFLICVALLGCTGFLIAKRGPHEGGA